MAVQLANRLVQTCLL